MRYIILLSFVFGILFARDNPFVAPKNMVENNVIRANVKPQHNNFDTKSIGVPNDARVFKYFVVGYQTLDGSVREKRILVNKPIGKNNAFIFNIKNNLPVILRNNNKGEASYSSSQAKKINEKKNIPKSNMTKTAQPKKPAKIKQKRIKSFFNFNAFGKTLIIRTNHVKLRDFMVSNPYKIVLDFKSNANFNTKSINIKDSSFKKVTFGSHSGYYRAAFWLDGRYSYRLTQRDNEIIVQLH